MDLGLKGKKAIVSGGSRGIGRAIVECLLNEGAHVAFCARSEAGVAQAQSQLGPNVFGSVVDVTSPASVEAWIAASAQVMGGIDIVVPNVSALAGGGDLQTWQ